MIYSVNGECCFEPGVSYIFATLDDVNKMRPIGFYIGLALYWAARSVVVG